METIYHFNVDFEGEKIKVAFVKPSHSEIEDAEYVYAQKFNKLLNDGFLSKAMMAKRFNDIGGSVSDKDVEDIGKNIKELYDNKRIIEFFEGSKDLTEEQKNKLEKAKDRYFFLQKEITDYTNNVNSMYNQSADSKAESHMIKWFVLNNSFYYEKIRKGEDLKEEAFSIFEGNSFEDKNSNFQQIFENENKDDVSSKRKRHIAKESILTLQRIAALWYQGLAGDQETSEQALKTYFADEKILQTKKEPAKKKVAKKKVAKKKDTNADEEVEAENG